MPQARAVRSSELIGRATEVALLRRAISQSAVTAVLGPIGVGKTALVRHVIGHAGRAGAPGPVVLECRSAPPDVDLATLLARAAGPASAGTTPARTEAAADARDLAATGRLIVLDGCDARPDEARALCLALREAGARILVTSTRALHIPGETVVPVRPLPRVRAGSSSLLFARQEAVRVFDRFARTVDPFFGLERGDEIVLADLITRCGGLPLLLQTAAVHVRALSLDAIRDLAPATLAALPPAADHDVAARVGAAVAALSPLARALLRAACTIEGEASLESLGVLSGTVSDERTRTEALTELVDSSLLLRRRAAHGVAFEAPASVRAVDPLPVDDVDRATALRRLADHLATLFASIEGEWVGPRQQHWSRRVAIELPLLEATLPSFLASVDGRSLVLRITNSLRLFWIVTNDHRRAAGWLEAGLARHDPPSAATGRALVHLAYMRVFMGDIAAAAIALERGTALCARLDPPGLAYAAMTRALLGIRGRSGLETEPAAFDPDLPDRFREPGHPRGLDFEPLFYLALLDAGRLDGGDLPPRVHEAGRVAERLDSDWARALARIPLALALARRDRAPRAVAELETSLRQLTELGDHAGVAMCLEVLSGIEAERGQYVRAVEYLAPAYEENVLGRHVLAGRMGAEPAALRSALGPKRFHSVYRDASRSAITQVATTALGEAARDRDAASPLDVDLSSREHDVARLVALGYSNPRIAATLVISPRTAEGHVQRILRKGGFGSRTEIGVWYSQRFGELPVAR